MRKVTNESILSYFSQQNNQSRLGSATERSMYRNKLTFKVCYSMGKDILKHYSPFRFSDNEELSYLIFLKKSVEKKYCSIEDRCIFSGFNKETQEDITNFEDNVVFSDYLSKAVKNIDWYFHIRMVKDEQVSKVGQLIDKLIDKLQIKERATEKTTAFLSACIKQKRQALVDFLKTLPFKQQNKIFKIPCSFCPLQQIEKVFYACSGNLSIVFCGTCRSYQNYLLKDCETVKFHDEASYLQAKQIQQSNHAQEKDKFMQDLQQRRIQANARARSIINNIQMDGQCQDGLIRL